MIFINPTVQGCFSMIPDWLMDRPELAPGSKLAYARLVRYAARDGVARPQQATLASELGVGERQARRYVADLEEQGLIHITQRGLGRSNEYRFLEHEWMAAPVPQPDPDGGPTGPDEDDRSRASADTDVLPERTNVSRMSGRTRPEQKKRQQEETTGRDKNTRRAKARQGTDEFDGLSVTGKTGFDNEPEEQEEPAAPRPIRRQSGAYGLATYFDQRASLAHRGDPRGLTPKGALRTNLQRLHESKGIEYADMRAAVDLFFGSEHYQRPGAPFFKSFLHHLEAILAKTEAAAVAELSDDEWVAAQTAKAVDPESLTDDEWAARQRRQYGGAA